MNNILIVDDDPHIRDVLRFALTKEGFKVTEAENGVEALKVFKTANPDLLILDIMMPEMDGTDVCREIRKQSNTPIIFLTSKDDEVDRIIGLELGGDDYVTKPFSPRELVARTRAVLRRAQSAHQVDGADAETLENGKLMMDMDKFKVFWQTHEITLTVTEFGLLKTLLRRPGKVFTRDELMNSAYDFNNVVSDRTIDSHMRRVRSKLAQYGGNPIETVHGLGYKLGSCE